MISHAQPMPFNAVAQLARFSRLLLNILAGAFLVFSLTKADFFVFRHALVNIQPSTIFTSGALVLGSLALVVGRGREAIRRSEFLLVPFVAICLVGLVNLFINEPASPRLGWILFFDFAVFLFSVCLAGLPLYRYAWRTYMFAALSVMIITLTIDAFVPGTFSNVDSRAAGFAENPNTAGLIAVALATCALRWNQDRVGFWDAVALGLAGACEFLSETRGGLLSFFLLVAIYLRNRIRLSSLPHLVALALLAFLLVWVAGQGLIPQFDLEFGRADMFVTGERVEETDSDQSRLDVIEESLRLTSLRPVSGWGNGYAEETMQVGPHNMYLARLVDNGIPGLIAYLWLLAALFRSAVKTTCHEGTMVVVLLAINGLVNHNLLEERTLWLLLGYSLGSSFLSRTS